MPSDGNLLQCLVRIESHSLILSPCSISGWIIHLRKLLTLNNLVKFCLYCLGTIGSEVLLQCLVRTVPNSLILLILRPYIELYMFVKDSLYLFLLFSMWGYPAIEIFTDEFIFNRSSNG